MLDFNLCVKTTFERYDPKLGLVRVLLSAMFAESALDKLTHYGFYVHEAAAHHIPLAAVAIGAAAFVEIAGCVAILAGFALTPALLLLTAYTVIVNFYYFDFWNMPSPAATGARKDFLKNLAVAAGILAYLAWALNSRREQGKRP